MSVKTAKMTALVLLTGALSLSFLSGCGGVRNPFVKTPTPTPSAESTLTEEEIISWLKSELTTGLAGASAAGEEVYFAFNDDVDYGILAIIDQDDVTILVGEITGSNQILRIMDDESGTYLDFTVEWETDSKGARVLRMTVMPDGAFCMLYPVNASSIIDLLSQY